MLFKRERPKESGTYWVIDNCGIKRRQIPFLLKIKEGEKIWFDCYYRQDKEYLYGDMCVFPVVEVEPKEKKIDRLYG